MGALHEGHISLIKKSINEADSTVVSIFVNNAQFSPQEDFSKYPRPLKKDSSILESLNVDVLFLPSKSIMYPEGFSTFVQENMLARGLESLSRPHFFKGVLTVVLKLFNIIQPDMAYFGEKDIQQLQLVQKMVKDFNLKVQVVPGKSVREPNGLAMSSRNNYLNDTDRKSLGIIYSSLVSAKKSIINGEKNSSTIKRKIKSDLNNFSSLRIDYVEISKKETLETISTIKGNVIISVAVFVGEVRLIDNISISI
jgi:pantoate--beta-alanine ligase